ncbi:MAG: GWxTD domain-containing protein [Saprospiraceae bacterium]|nr:GWxTD domain-containing protein [Saprospiraceae bacterium]
MKMKSALLALALMLVSQLAHALDAGVSYAVYATPEKPYLEINIEIAAASVMYRHVDSVMLQAGVEVLILVKQGDETVKFDKYVLNSPLVDFPQALLDVKRMSLPNGDYLLEISFVDVNDPENKALFKRPLKVAVGTQIHLSEVQLLRSFRRDDTDNPFTKNGFFLEPLPFLFYDQGAKLLAFYAEIYHSNKDIQDPAYLVRYFIEQEKGNDVTNLISIGHQRKKPSPIDAVLVQMDISKLESGNYFLTVEVRNAANELLATRKVAFQRSNPLLELPEKELTEEFVHQQFVQHLDEAALRYGLRAVSAYAIGEEPEMLKNILQGGDLSKMRFYLFRHFMREDPNNPEQAYKKFLELAAAVDKKFRSGFRYGFETDRGRTFLRFGRPDDLVTVENEPGAVPYEIWVYYKFPKTQQNNVKFLFYNPSLAGEDYLLLHSTARGEISNPRWERVLYSRNSTEYVEDGNYHDATGTQRNLGRNARQYFQDF